MPPSQPSFTMLMPTSWAHQQTLYRNNGNETRNQSNSSIFAYPDRNSNIHTLLHTVYIANMFFHDGKRHAECWCSITIFMLPSLGLHHDSWDSQGISTHLKVPFVTIYESFSLYEGRSKSFRTFLTISHLHPVVTTFVLNCKGSQLARQN